MTITQVHNNIYAVKFGDKVIVLRNGRYVLRRAGKCLGRWLKYLVGVIVNTGEKIKVCLGEACDCDIETWVISGNGSVARLAYRMVEFFLGKLEPSQIVEIVGQYV